LKPKTNRSSLKNETNVRANVPHFVPNLWHTDKALTSDGFAFHPASVQIDKSLFYRSTPCPDWQPATIDFTLHFVLFYGGGIIPFLPLPLPPQRVACAETTMSACSLADADANALGEKGEKNAVSFSSLLSPFSLK
jgi:hypothetical protein